MHTVWKFPLPLADVFELPLPDGCKVLSVQIQRGDPCLWALVDPEQPLKARRFRWAGTGHPIHELNGLEFIGTVQVDGGAFIFHLFEQQE